MFRVDFKFTESGAFCKEVNGVFTINLTEFFGDIEKLLFIERNVEYLNYIIKDIRSDINRYCDILTNNVTTSNRVYKHQGLHYYEYCTDDRIKTLISLIHIITKDPNIIKTVDLDKIPITLSKENLFGANIFYNETDLNLSIKNIQEYSETENFYIKNVYLDYFNGKACENDRPDFNKYYVYNFDNVLYIVEEL